MPWNKKLSASLFIIGIIVIAIGLFLNFYPTSVIANFKQELEKKGISTDYRYFLEGSLSWWVKTNFGTFQPISQVILFSGFLFILAGVIYSIFGIWQKSPHEPIERVTGNIDRNTFETQEMQTEETEESQPLPEIPQAIPKRATMTKKTGFPVASGILEIIASCIAVIVGFVLLAGFAVSLVYPYRNVLIGNLVIGLLNVVFFAFGLTSGVFSLKRKHFVMVIIGEVFTLVAGFVTILGIGLTVYSAWLLSVIIGVPIVILSLLAVIFISISKREFWE